MIWARPALEQDVREVRQHLSPITRAEVNCSIAAGAKPSGRARPVQAIVRDDVASALFYLSDQEDGRITTSFAAAEGFFRNPVFTRFLKRLLATVEQENPGRPIECRSWGHNPRAARWFEIIGFHRVIRAPEYTIYRYGVEKKG